MRMDLQVVFVVLLAIFLAATVGCESSRSTIPTDLEVGDVIVLTGEAEVYSNYRVGQNKRTCIAPKGELVKKEDPTPNGNTYFKYVPLEGVDVDSWRDYCKKEEEIFLGVREIQKLPGYVVRRG